MIKKIFAMFGVLALLDLVTRTSYSVYGALYSVASMLISPFVVIGVLASGLRGLPANLRLAKQRRRDRTVLDGIEWNEMLRRTGQQIINGSHDEAASLVAGGLPARSIFLSGKTLDDLLPRVSDDTLDELVKVAIVSGRISGETLCSADESSLRRIGDAISRVYGNKLVAGGHAHSD